MRRCFGSVYIIFTFLRMSLSLSPREMTLPSDLDVLPRGGFREPGDVGEERTALNERLGAVNPVERADDFVGLLDHRELVLADGHQVALKAVMSAAWLTG